MNVHDVAALVGGEVVGEGAGEIDGVNALELAGPTEISLYLGGKYRKLLEGARAGALLCAPGTEATGFPVVVVERPRLRLIDIIAHFHPPTVRRGIHPAATVAADALIGRDVFIGAGAVIGAGARVGDGTEIHEGVVLYPGVTIGDGCIVYANAVLRDGTAVGSRVIIHPGAVLGADGFGFEPDGRGVFRKIPQVGRVVVEDDAEIGANTCVDRAAFGETRIGRGTKLDNLCQIGHGVKIGSDCVLSGTVAIGGSTVLGNHVMMGGNARAADHVVIGDGTLVAGGAGVIGDVPPRSLVAGFPHTDLRTWKRAMVALYNLARRPHKAPGEGEGA